MTCQRCYSPYVISFTAKCSDRFSMDGLGFEYDGYVPRGGPFGRNSDCVSQTLCLTCGQVQGTFPVSVPELNIEEDDLCRRITYIPSDKGFEVFSGGVILAQAIRLPFVPSPTTVCTYDVELFHEDGKIYDRHSAIVWERVEAEVEKFHVDLWGDCGE